MRILHYSLGFPPYRSGGLTKFCMDLMLQQNQDGHEVALMWPGEMRFANRKTFVVKRKDYTVGSLAIRSFEVINPLPVSFDEGIRDFAAFTEKGDHESFNEILDSYKPDVIHVHTLMGLHESFLDLARECGIRIVFTAHDYFPICPKVTVFRHGKVCNSVRNCSECGVCNASALGLNKIRILQSSLYRNMKDSIVVKKLRKIHRDNYLNGGASETVGEPVGEPEDFLKMREHFKGMLQKMDVIHYNSSVTRAMYETYMGKMEHRLIGISHGDIADHRRIKEFSDDMIRIRYLGPYSSPKGYLYLAEALDDLWKEKKNFRLDVHFTPAQQSPYMVTHERFTPAELESIFDETDVMIAPSVCHETFGYTVLEALSYGVPVIITENVGAKDILVPGGGIILQNPDKDNIYEAVNSLNAESLSEMNRKIVSDQKIMTLSEMTRVIMEECYL